MDPRSPKSFKQQFWAFLFFAEVPVAHLRASASSACYTCSVSQCLQSVRTWWEIATHAFCTHGQEWRVTLNLLMGEKLDVSSPVKSEEASYNQLSVITWISSEIIPVKQVMLIPLKFLSLGFRVHNQLLLNRTISTWQKKGISFWPCISLL